MKKEYQKPQMAVENFILSDYIAACDTKMTFSLNCTLPDGPAGTWIQFVIDDGGFESTEVCQTPMDDESFSGIICKHNTTGTVQVFAS